MSSTRNRVVFRSERWAESVQAEERGDLFGALNIHRKIMSEATTSYHVMQRAGWLYYRLGLYEIALRYHALACSVSTGKRALYGSSDCLSAQGEAEALESMAESVYGTERRMLHSAAA
ncbi:hypothetical protein P4B35_20755 [Pontiellaceae bacterium B12227]|nr:hypothetical protein [Pontiellaceae bacterium B12227]